jgi:L-alanine-DL-glutamate epimerase-like enolase superfamily enzyme
VNTAAAVASLAAAAYKIPTDAPESDGTASWDSTTLVVVEAEAGGRKGLGYTYCQEAAATLINSKLGEIVCGADAFDIPATRAKLLRSVRNLGRPGVAACAISAIDACLWDLKAKLLDMPLASLLGRRRDAAPIYGSGGFTSYSDRELREQLGGWVARDGCRFVKMKIGREPARDPHRIEVARAAIGEAALFVDGNGAFSAKQALRLAEQMRGADIEWFEEPVTSDDPSSLHLLRERLPASMEVAAGEYIYSLDDARILLQAGAVDVLQADATRCGGVSGFLQVDALCEAHHIDLSAHCAPALHRPLACAAVRLRHIEWFHDHVRLEGMLFDGAPKPENGEIRPDLSRPGLGLEFKRQDAERYRIATGA